eukprot:Hpha_TRINITY_DN33546_c0_g1::TRINITY_DN33546_c0_g1_i1::g.171125::m.171125
MAAEGPDEASQQDLSDVIKGHHKRLRDALRKGKTVDEVWKENLGDQGGLQSYADAMRDLGTRWEGHGSDRVEWAVQQVLRYFGLGPVTETEEGADDVPGQKRRRETEPALCGLVGALTKPVRRDYFTQHGKMMPTDEHRALAERVLSEHGVPAGQRVRILDVGSCYNPLVRHPLAGLLEVTATDLCPAAGSAVLRCDWTEVGFGEAERREAGCLEVVRRGSYDAVLFSLLLSYLPCPRLRLRCVENAFRALRHQGLLLIEEPRTIGKRDAAWSAEWRNVIEALGFVRQSHAVMAKLVCTGYRKHDPSPEPLKLSPADAEKGLRILADEKE